MFYIYADYFAVMQWFFILHL